LIFELCRVANERYNYIYI